MDERTIRLQARREAALDARKSIVDHASAEQREELTASEDALFRKLTDEVAQYDERLTELGDEVRRSTSLPDGMQHARRGNPDEPAKTWLPGLAEYRTLQLEQRAVGTTGAFIPVAASNLYFDLLRKRTALLAAGPVGIGVEGAGSIEVPKATSAITVSPTGENTAITPADPGLGEITLDPKKLAALTMVAREAIEDSSPNLRSVVANSLIRDTAVALDAQLLVGSGSGGNMLGLRNISGATAGPSTGTNGTSLSSATGFGIVADTLAAAEAANVDPDKLAWFMHSRTFNSIRKLVDTNGRPIVVTDVTEGLRPTLFGKPVFASNNLSVTETAGSSNNASSILLADMSQVVVATSRTVELVISEHFAFDKDQVALRCTCRYDIGVPQPTAVTITTGLLP